MRPERYPLVGAGATERHGIEDATGTLEGAGWYG